MRRNYRTRQIALGLFAPVALAACLAGLPQASAGEWDDRPGLDFYRQSSDAFPCGRGPPPLEHFAWEVHPADLPAGLTLTVKQDRHRLCYVVGSNAEAPVIRIRAGEELTITLRNEITDPAAIDAVTASQDLAQPNAAIPAMAGFYPVLPGMRHIATGITNLHVHGFAVPPVAPEDEVLRTCADPAVGPAICGHREVTYHYRIPADMPAGLYWYHPHVHGEIMAQLMMGLSGAIVVEGPADDARRAAGIEDRIFVVRQVADVDFRRPATHPAIAMPMDHPSPDTAAAPASAVNVDTAHELGCGNAGVDEITLNGALVSDRAEPDDALDHVEIPAGKTQLWRVLNAATDAYLDLALIGQDQSRLPIHVVAIDGAPVAVDGGGRGSPISATQPQLVPPAGRIEFLIQAPEAGHGVYLMSRAVDTGCAGDKVPERKLLLITAAPGAAAAPPRTVATPIADDRADIFAGLLARKADRERRIALAEYPRPGSRDEVDYYIAERRPGIVLRPYEPDAAPAITVHAGTTEEWIVENWTHELHAFHIHQLHFLLLDVNGVAEAGTPLLDVANVPYATVGKDGHVVVPGRIRIKIGFPTALAGDIPFHCHLADHEDNGMMAVLRVLPEATAPLPQHAALDPRELLTHPPICRGHAGSG